MSKRTDLNWDGLKYEVGGMVSVEKWDSTEPPWNRLGSPAVIEDVSQEWCSSGYMLTVVGANGKKQWLDQDWLAPWVKG